MNRRDFVRITGGVLVTIGTPRASAGGPRHALDPSYLELGLTAMARAEGWFEAHWGAALIAAYYLCEENDLDEETTAAIREQLGVVTRTRSRAFRPFEPEPAVEGAVPSILESLLPTLEGGLRAHGHASIYTALATRALGDAPHMAFPSIVDPIRRWNGVIAKRGPKRPPGETTHYRDSQAMVEATFANLLRFEPLVGRPAIKRPNFTHQVTHTEALARLDALGHTQLARRGHPAHRAHLDDAVPDATRDALDRSEVTLAGILDESFWRDPERQALWKRDQTRDNPNGEWIAAGHLFKVLYAFHAIAKRIPDARRVERAATVLFERYFDPDVKGG